MIIIYNNLDFHRRACVPLELKKIANEKYFRSQIIDGIGTQESK
jgi:hypothetical protein